MKEENRYLQRGVSAKKEEVKKAVNDNNNKHLFPGAFCHPATLPSAFFSNNKEKEDELLYLLHADGAGTKASLAYLYWKETGDVSVFKGIAQDSMVMNTDDLLCVGATNCFHFSSTIGRNKKLIPFEVLKAIIDGSNEFIEQLRSWGIKATLLSGETADIGDLVQTVVVDHTLSSFLKRSDFIDASNITSEMAIIGLASYGKSSYETQENSGIGSNGLTSSRHDLLHKKYKFLYPQSYNQFIQDDVFYEGNFLISDPLPGSSLTIGQALLSPTRTYLPVIRPILETLKDKIKAIIHVSGGGQTKCLNFSKNIHYIKDNLFNLPPIFQELSKKNSLKELFTVFNCGNRLEIYTDFKYAQDVIDIANSFFIDAQIIGRTEKALQKDLQLPEGNRLTISYQNEELDYYS